MTSFYNNYYRYYRPYLSTNFKNSSDVRFSHPVEDKLSYEKDFEQVKKNSEEKKKSSRCYYFGPINFKNPLFNDIEEPIFEILGIQLYLDDIIILGLLFFLYQEGVQDEMLFIALILLLLS